jgi:hypothetical protein
LTPFAAPDFHPAVSRGRAREGDDAPRPLDPALVAWITGPVGIAVASRDADMVPDLAQGLGCRVTAEGRVVLVLAAAQAPGLLACLEAGAPLAVTFSVPSTNRTVQLKASSSRVGPARRADRDAVARYRVALERELASVGFPPPYTRALLAADDDGLATITFTPREAFDQSPGPLAGRRLPLHPEDPCR